MEATMEGNERKVPAKDTFLLQYQLDTEDIKYAKEIQWRIPTVLVALYSAVIAALSFWKQANLVVKRLPAVLFIIALFAFGAIGIVSLNGNRKTMNGYRKRQERISSTSFEMEFHKIAIKPVEYVRNKSVDFIFQIAFSIIILLSWLASSIMMISLT
jgi:ABC-type branched-subunit amino acid transport system permease subunit